MPFQPFPPDLRASDADREATVERLRVASTEGRLDHEELEERLTLAYRARYCKELARLTADITPPQARPYRSRAYVAPVQERRTNSMAIASLVLSLCWFLFVLGPILAILAGHRALAQIRRSPGTQKGRGLAAAGLMIGYFELFALAARLLFWFPHVHF
jgi:hypothetical protein